MQVYGVDEPSTAQNVVAAAKEILLAEGAAAVTMRRVAQAVGVTPMTIYRHFANRDALLRHIADTAFAEIAEQWLRSAAQAASGDVEARMLAVLDDYLDFALDQPRLYEFAFGERREEARMYPTDFRAGRSPTLNILADLLAEAMRTGRFRDDDGWDIAIMLAALLHGFVQLYHGGRIGLTPEQFRALCHSSTERVFHGLRN